MIKAILEKGTGASAFIALVCGLNFQMESQYYRLCVNLDADETLVQSNSRNQQSAYPQPFQFIKETLPSKLNHQPVSFIVLEIFFFFLMIK